MAETLNPCTRCNGSGTEPDPITEAFDAMVREVNRITSDANSRGWAMERYRGACASRITFLEAALRDMLSRFGPEIPNAESYAFGATFWKYEDVHNWRAVLDGRDAR